MFHRSWPLRCPSSYCTFFHAVSGMEWTGHGLHLRKPQLQLQAAATGLQCLVCSPAGGSAQPRYQLLSGPHAGRLELAWHMSTSFWMTRGQSAWAVPKHLPDQPPRQGGHLQAEMPRCRVTAPEDPQARPTGFWQGSEWPGQAVGPRTLRSVQLPVSASPLPSLHSLEAALAGSLGCRAFSPALCRNLPLFFP